MDGIGVLINRMCDEGFDIESYVGQRITDAEINDNEQLVLSFGDRKLFIYDAGQSCCEYRHMSTDDEIRDLVGRKFLDVVEKEYISQDDDYDCHEELFMEVRAEESWITLVNHNEHNGYYGGFWLRIDDNGSRY